MQCSAVEGEGMLTNLQNTECPKYLDRRMWGFYRRNDFYGSDKYPLSTNLKP